MNRCVEEGLVIGYLKSVGGGGPVEVPQQTSSPEVRIPHVVRTPAAISSKVPAGTTDIPQSSREASHAARSPCRWPAPKHATVPSSRSAQVWLVPALTC